MSDKPVVNYTPFPEQVINVGEGAIVWPTNHPGDRVSNKRFAVTSFVMSYDEDTGEFETLNTIYKRENPDEE